MEKTLHEYFLPEYQFYLDDISYHRLGDNLSSQQLSLSCSDNISVTLTTENKATVLLTREVKFNPTGIFTLSIRFGAELTMNEEVSKGIDWGAINLAEEFRKQGGFVINNLMSRASLLTSEITASFGQQPLVLPGSLIE